jgi:predicted Zn-dependent protease
MKLSKSLLQEHMATRQQEVLAEAITIVNQGLEVMPDSNELAIRSADTLQAAGRLREAIDQLDTVLRRRPASTAVRQRLISAYLDTHDHDKAIDTAKQGITVSPDRGMWYESLGDLHRAASDDLVAASAAYLQAFDRNRSQSLLVKLAVATRTTSPWDYQAAHDLLIASPGLVASQPLAQGLLARAEAGLGLDNRAQDHLRNAYHAHVKTIEAGGAGPRSMEFWYDDLFVIFGEDDAQKGDDLAQELIGSTPTLWDLTGRGKYWASIEGGKGKAIEILQTAVGRGRTEDSNRVPLLLSILGNYQLRNGDLEAAAASFKESSELRPSDPMAMNNYAYVLGVNLNRPAEAEEFSIRAVQLSPRNANLLDTLATIQAMKGDYSRALATRLQQLVATPGDSDLLVKIASLHANDLQQPAKALPFIDQAMAIRPGDASATSDAGWYYTQAGKVVEGEEFLRKAERADPSARTLIRLATVMLSDDRLSQARRRLESAMETDPDEATRAEILALLDDIRSRESP